MYHGGHVPRADSIIRLILRTMPCVPFSLFLLSEERREFRDCSASRSLFFSRFCLSLLFLLFLFFSTRMQMQNALCTIYVRAILLLLPAHHCQRRFHFRGFKGRRRARM